MASTYPSPVRDVPNMFTIYYLIEYVSCYHKYEGNLYFGKHAGSTQTTVLYSSYHTCVKIRFFRIITSRKRNFLCELSHADVSWLSLCYLFFYCSGMICSCLSISNHCSLLPNLQVRIPFLYLMANRGKPSKRVIDFSRDTDKVKIWGWKWCLF